LISIFPLKRNASVAQISFYPLAGYKAAGLRSLCCGFARTDGINSRSFPPKRLVLEQISSSMSARNVAQHLQVCLSFVDVFVQKGFKLLGTAREVRAGNAEFATWAQPLLAMVGQRFTIHSVLVVQVKSVAAIVAPSYRFYPDDTTEASQVASTLRRYGMVSDNK
jgi:predicted pyridoxine 5'-phosphate oxidase superfamily flavin-nucleotide-binding protein